MITDEAKVNEEYSESDDDNEIESKVIETIEEHDEPNPTLVKFNSDNKHSLFQSKRKKHRASS